MSNSIASSALVLSTDSSKLTGPLPGLAGRLKGWASSTASGVSQKLSGMFGGVAGAVAGIGAGLVGGIGVGKLVDSIGDISKINDAAKAFHLTSEAASGLFGVLGASGSDIRESTESLLTMQTRIRDVMTGTGEESKKLFAGLSISAADIANLPVDEQFYRLHEAITTAGDGLENYRLGLVAGEDGMKTLQKLLGRSTAELRAQAKGFELSTESVATATLAQQSMNSAGVALSSVWNKIVIAAAPAVEFFARIIPPALDAIGEKFGGLGDVAMPVLKGMSKAGAFVLDIFRSGLGVVKVFAGGVTAAFGGVIKALRNVVDLAKSLPDHLRPTWVDGLSDSIRSFEDNLIGKGNAAIQDGLSAIQGFGIWQDRTDQFFDNWQKERAQKIKDAANRTPTGKGIDAPAPKGKQNESQVISAVLAGTKEAFELQARFNSQGLLGDKGKIDAQQLSVQKDIRAGIRDVASALRERGGDGLELI